MIPNTPNSEFREIDSVKPYCASPRVHSPAKIRKLAKLIQRHGQVQPVLIDHNGVIVDGHAVLEAVRLNGDALVLTMTVPSRDPADIKALRLALNRLPQEAKWNEGKLRGELEELLQLSYDLELTGFDTVEIDMMLDVEDPQSGLIEDEPPEPDRTKPALARPGDLWVCGSHRVLCGDARSPDTVARLMAGANAQMVFCDPPYNVKVDGFVSGSGKHREFAMASGEMSKLEFTSFLTTFLSTTAGVCIDGAIVFVCMDWRHMEELLAAAGQAALKLMNLVVWSKTQAGMGSFYRSQHELVFVLKAGGAAHINNFELGQKGRSRANVWTYRGMNSASRERDELLKLHPTIKPVALVADAIKDVSHRGGIVLDPFLGSGTTLIAAERMGRRCRGLEIDPLYVDVILGRWVAETGEMPVEEASGEIYAARIAAAENEAGAAGAGEQEEAE